MKSILICTMILFSFNSFALNECSPEAQQQIDSLLSKIHQTQDQITKVDLEFQVRRISFSYSNCRKSILVRDLASVETQAPDLEIYDYEDAELQAQANQEMEYILGLK